MKPNIYKILLSPLFIIGLFLLLLNDFYLKAAFSNFLTGKISDFAGLFIFPLFWAAFFPTKRLLIYMLTGILFVCWKSPFSQGLIDFWNSFEILKISRVVDFSDLSALSVLTISYHYYQIIVQKSEKFRLKSNPDFLQKIKVSLVSLFSLFAFTATSYEQDRNVSLDNKYEFKMNIKSFEKLVRDEETFYIHAIEPTRDLSIPVENVNTIIKHSPYILYFDLKTPYCESKNIRIFSLITKDDNSVTLGGPTMSYWCDKPPTEKDKAELSLIFEREVIEKIRQNSSR